MKYLDWKYDWQIKKHEVNVDFNDERLKKHLSALVCRSGSSTEEVVNDFALGQTNAIYRFQSVQEAWDRLDDEQQDYVLAFRNLLGQPILGSKQEFPNLFYVQKVRDQYLNLKSEYEEQLDCQTSSVHKMEELAWQAKKFVDSTIRTESTAPLWVVCDNCLD